MRSDTALEIASRIAHVAEQLAHITRELVEAAAEQGPHPLLADTPTATGPNATIIKQIAYSVPETAAALSISPDAVRQLIRDGEIDTRNTGARYILAGGAILDWLGTGHRDINDHRVFLDRNKHVAYQTGQVAKLLGVGDSSARRLFQTGAIRHRSGARRYMAYGSAVLAFLNGTDDPMHHPDNHWTKPIRPDQRRRAK